MGMIIDGIGCSEAIDSSGELLKLKGLDISDLVEGRGVLNTEHRGDDAPGYSYLDIIGRVIYAKKIYTRGDCENDRQRKYWDECKLPYLYIKCELFDSDEDGDHPSAKAAAAMIRHYTRRGLPILIRYSIEGSTLEMKDKVIEAAIARRVASTIKPANKTCNSGILEDDFKGRKKKDGSFLGGEGGVVEEDSDEGSFTKFERPDAMKLGRSVTVACDPEVDEVSETFREAVQQFAGLTKTIAAGSYNAAPSTLTGGAALMREDLGMSEEQHRKLVAVCKGAIRDHDPAVHGPFKSYLKSLLPEASDEFLDRFDALSDELGVRANLKAKYLQKAQAARKTSPQVQIPVQHQSTYKPPQSRKGARKAGQKVRDREEREGLYQETLARIKTAQEEHDSDLSFNFGAAATNRPELPPVETGTAPRPRPSMKLGTVEVDTDRGILYIGGDAPATEEENKKRAEQGKPPKRQLPPRAYRLYAPTDAAYMDIMSDPKNNEHHDRAMHNWVTVHRLLRQGKLPDKLIAHTSMYTLMAPNESGTIQDLAYGLYQDLIAKGFDPTKDYGDDELSDWEREYADMAAGQHIPNYMHDYFMSQASGIWRGPNQQELESGNTKAGLFWSQPLSDFIPPGGKPEDARLRSAVGKVGLSGTKEAGKWNTVQAYRMTHALLTSLVQEHGTNANKMVEQFLRQKWDQEKGGKLGFGFGIKTIRYTGGMLGMGQHVVPDTHFIRHLFGMHLKDPRLGDAKGIFEGDSPHREQALRGIDEWFRKNHPAFEWTRQKLQREYGEDFGEHATFPAFWHHWTLIPLHDAARGWSAGQADNMATDHEVFWNSARNILRQFGLPTDPHDPRLRKAEAWKNGGSLPARTAYAQRAIEDRFGPVAASYFFHRYLAPLLLAADQDEKLYKAEVLTRLMKGEFAEEPEQATVMHNGAVVQPGEVEFLHGPKQGERLRLVSIGNPYHHVLTPTGGLQKLMANHPAIRINKEPKLVRTSTTVDARKHGHPTLHSTQDQHDIVHGIDMAKRVAPGKKGYAAANDDLGTVGWYQSNEGRMVYVKPESLANGGTDTFAGDGFTPTMRDTAFSRAMHEFFGLGDHVPVTTTFKHPVTGEWHSAIERAEGEHYSPKSHKHREALGAMARTGLLDRLALADMILGQGDRHTENGLISPDGRSVKLIDSGLSWSEPGVMGGHFIPAVNEFWALGSRHNDGDEWYSHPLHPSTVSWVQSLNPQKLAKLADTMGVPKKYRDEAVRRLTAVQRRLKRPASRGAAYFAPFFDRTGRRTPSRWDLENAGFLGDGESATRPSED